MPFPKPTMRTIARWIAHLTFTTLVLAGAAWTALAISIQLNTLPKIIAWIALGSIVLVCLITRFRTRRRAAWLVAGIAALGVAGWYQTIRPSHDRDWAFDVTNTLTATTNGDRVTLTGVRDFDWIDRNTATENWINASYDLSQLSSVDMITSVWDSPDIAHLLVSFGFTNGQHVAFSVETRKESHESFSVLGGFFRQYELALIAATEDDIIKLRTNHRREDVRMYAIDLSPKQRRDLFMSYVELAQDLDARPAFYNTLTANCTTTVYKLSKVIKPDLGPDWRVVMSGHLADYIEHLGGFSDHMPIEERKEKARITAKALAYSGPDFSLGIRN